MKLSLGGFKCEAPFERWLLGMAEAAEIEFEPPRLMGKLHEPADLG